ncbi:30S ribosomal protein S10 [Candidatus Fokinia solitaria]|uniref:Small ribosomal subunit protein uS10 n=1 Tax=Candidatus Fokinia solitaria TaxID=1802984 RepID=A0A2U8BST2_9RICK|nr:30S ribosomal protein S10 [Candidatus Fokinia solitaria]AWD33358.1 30S ribosomal protein S10 [Candidatus Fokinia solitaria]
MTLRRIRIALKSFDETLIQRASMQIISSAQSSGASVKGPIPLPTRKKIFTVNRSPHVDKKSREQFELSCHKRMCDIYVTSEAITGLMDAFKALELPAGVEVFIK